MGWHYCLHYARQGGEGDQEHPLLRPPIDCSTSNGIPEQMMCCYTGMGKFASKIKGGSKRCTNNGPSPFFGSVPVWARSITGTGIQKWCLYRYWQYTLVQYQYGHGPLWVLAFKNGAHTRIGIFTLLFSTSMAQSITGTGIQWCLYRYWQFFTLVQYQYGYGPLPILAFSGAHTVIGSILWFSASMGTVHYQYITELKKGSSKLI